MSKAPHEARTWERHADQAEGSEEAPDTLEKLRREVRRRNDLTRLHRALSRDYPDRT